MARKPTKTAAPAAPIAAVAVEPAPVRPLNSKEAARLAEIEQGRKKNAERMAYLSGGAPLPPKIEKLKEPAPAPVLEKPEEVAFESRVRTLVTDLNEEQPDFLRALDVLTQE